jgi:hypothetical protein
MSTKTKSRSNISTTFSRAKSKDNTPDWHGCETWSADQFNKHFKISMDFYRLEADNKFAKPAVLKWMESEGYDKEDISNFKKIKDSRVNTTMGAVASCLLKGMTAQRDDFNNGKDTTEWLRKTISEVLLAGKNDIEEQEIKENKSPGPVINIQDRLREATLSMTEEIEDAIYSWQTDPESFDPKAFKVLNLLKGKQAKAAHARIIRDFYSRDLAELEELASGNADDQLREGYSHRSRKHIKKFIEFLREVNDACTMLMQEAKVTRKPRAKKSQPKEKIVAKLKYKKSDEPLKLVSINPTDIIGAKELWIYNVKTRKLGKYVAGDFQELAVKGASIVNFNETSSVCKTLRKPEEKLKEFKAANKVQLRKFLEEINATDTKLNGRINEETILLKIS